MDLLGLAELVLKLKNIPRSGWLIRGISPSEAESVAEHSFSTALLTLVVADGLAKEGVEVDSEKAIKMALLHDLSESLTFDIDKAFARQLGEAGSRLVELAERSAIERILGLLPSLAEGYRKLLEEWKSGASIEAKIARACDSFDMLLQARSYERHGHSRELFEAMRKKALEAIKGSGIRPVIEAAEKLAG